MEEWKEYKLGEIARPIKDRIDTSVLDKTSYISTENMLPNKTGITSSSGVPLGNAIRFQEGDVLISNIRPYFKKIWRADNVGGCSADVICLRATDKVEPLYLFYLLSQDVFFDYVMQGAKGTKMPRGDRNQIMQWPVFLPSKQKQKETSSFLKSLDDKIDCNRRINDNLPWALWMTHLILLLFKRKNDNLEQQAQALFKSWFVDFEPFKDGEFVESELGMIPKNWSVKQLGDVTVQQNEKVKDRIDVKVLSPVTTGELVLSEEYFTKQVYSESVSKYIVVKPKDFAYNPARVNIGSLGMNEFEFDGCVSPVYVVFRCEDEYQYYFDLFRHTDFFKEEVKTRAIGGVRQSLGYKDFSLIKVVYPPIDVIHKFNQIYSRILANVKNSRTETARLASLRDTLLPKLMSGKLKTTM